MTRRKKSRALVVGIALSSMLFSGHALGAVEPERPLFENEHFRLRLIPRTPNQIAAFYEARGFPGYAVDQLRRLCFITVGFRNKSDRIIWHDLDAWTITGPQGPIERYRRDYWPEFWEKTGLERRFQSTFRWTLMPEQLDFRPAEAEGGNIILPRVQGPFRIDAKFILGDEQQGRVFDVTIDKLYCGEDPKP